MKKSFRFILLFIIFSLLTACATNTSPVASLRPSWIDNPGNGVSASAGMNVKGRVAQEETAIARARVEFAKRFGVAINSNQSLTTTVSNNRSTTSGAQVSQESLQQSDIRAAVKEKWRDEEADVLWVWLVPAN
jgi:hypothetical protein